MARYKTRRLLGTAGVALLATVLPLQGCDTAILEVTDPDIILDANSASGALALRNGVILRLSQGVTGVQSDDALFLFAGLLTDEWRSGDTFVQRNNQDQRIFDPANTFNDGPNRSLNRVRVEGEAAIRALRQYVPDSTHLVAQMFALTGYVETLIAEHYCNGTPLSRVEGQEIIEGDPLTNDSVFALAATHADSAIATASTGPNATQRTRMVNLASIVKGRALVGRGQFAAAAAAVATVPTTYRYSVTHSLNVNTNQIWGLNNNARRYTMVDREGGNGIDYVSANDPRLRRRIGGNVFDSANPTTLIQQGTYGRTDSVPIANGIEARLIEAEANLQSGATAAWLATINSLRTNAALYPPLGTGLTGFPAAPPPLTALSDPGTQAARVDIHFRERAFWFFSTGRRLGDMRRLVRLYGRDPATVFPLGPYFKGGNYGPAVNMPVPFDEVNNTKFVQCLNTDA